MASNTGDVNGTGTSGAAAPSAGASPTEVLALTIAGVVERQLSAHAAAINEQMANQRRANEQYQQALQAALEARLQELAAHQLSRMTALEARLDALAAGGLPAGAGSGADSADVHGYVDHQIGLLAARFEESQKTVRRFDEQASALVQHVNETTAALSRRMDEGDQALAHAVEQRLVTIREAFDGIGTEVHRQLTEYSVGVNAKFDTADARVTDRMLAMEERIKEESGTKVASLEATIGRIGAGFDDALGAISQRLLEVDNKQGDQQDRLAMLAEQLSRVDETAINEVKEQLSSAVGEAMLVRIELDRFTTMMNERLDKNAVRMSEIEALLADEMDVSAAVQLERLDELERAMALLDPTQFVRKDGSSGPAAPAAVAPPATDAFSLPSLGLDTSLGTTTSA